MLLKGNQCSPRLRKSAIYARTKIFNFAQFVFRWWKSKTLAMKSTDCTLPMYNIKQIIPERNVSIDHASSPNKKFFERKSAFSASKGSKSQRTLP